MFHTRYSTQNINMNLMYSFIKYQILHHEEDDDQTLFIVQSSIEFKDLRFIKVVI